MDDGDDNLTRSTYHTHRTAPHRSIAPNIFGHMDIKRGLLLMMLGGVHKTTKEVGVDGRRAP